jgi:hypothetical protein
MGFTIDTTDMDEDDVAILDRAENIKDRTLYDVAWFLIAGNAHDSNVLEWVDSLVALDRELTTARA